MTVLIMIMTRITIVIESLIYVVIALNACINSFIFVNFIFQIMKP